MGRLGFALGLFVLASACGAETGDSTGAEPDAGADAGSELEAGVEAGTPAEALERYMDPDAQMTLQRPYASGMDLVVDNVKGDILLVPGEAGTVVAVFEPFTYRGGTQESEAILDLENGLSVDVRTEGDQIVVESLQLGEWEELGATLTVALPPEFDGAIRVVNRSAGNIDEANIDIDEGAAASAFSVSMESQGLGDCNLDGAPSIIDTNASCRGRIEITNVSDDVTAYSDGYISSSDPFAIRVHLAGISADASGGEIESTEGNVELNLPPDGNFRIAAVPNASGAFNVVTPPDGCDLAESSLSCGAGGAIFSVSAGTDDSFDAGNVNISFN